MAQPTGTKSAPNLDLRHGDFMLDNQDRVVRDDMVCDDISTAKFQTVAPAAVAKNLPKTGVALKDEFLDKISSRHVNVGIIGLGYVGLPLAKSFSVKGFTVLGFDIDRIQVDLLQRGESYIGHISADAIREMREHGFEATSQFE